jgi:hypothetical protein
MNNKYKKLIRTHATLAKKGDMRHRVQMVASSIQSQKIYQPNFLETRIIVGYVHVHEL